MMFMNIPVFCDVTQCCLIMFPDVKKEWQCVHFQASSDIIPLGPTDPSRQ
jgi:hypothetical protein